MSAPYSTVKLCSIQVTAQHIADAANVAYWTASGSQDSSGYHLRQLVEEFETLAAKVAELRALHPVFAPASAEPEAA